MYKLKVNNKNFTIPKKNITIFALHEAISRGVVRGGICDEESAIKYLNSIGIEVETI